MQQWLLTSALKAAAKMERYISKLNWVKHISKGLYVNLFHSNYITICSEVIEKPVSK